MNHGTFIQESIKKSKESVILGGFPVGAVVVRKDEILSSGISNGKQLNDPTSHAEITAIREACLKLKTRDLKDAVLYSSLEPCLMCFSASSWASISKIVYACSRKRVEKQHIKGNHDLNIINRSMIYSIELIHFSELEEKALKIIKDWERIRHNKQANKQANI